MLQSDEKLHRALLNPSADDIHSALRFEMWTIGLLLVVVGGCVWRAATYGVLLSGSRFPYLGSCEVASFACALRVRSRDSTDRRAPGEVEKAVS